MKVKSLDEAILERIEIRPDTTCWNWTGAIHIKGYGQFRRRGINWRAHRLVYEWFVGLIPEGMTLDHLCRNKRCVNPDHLEVTTNEENTRRSWKFRVRPTHCHNGHPFDEENTYLNSGRRHCRACRSATTARTREALKGLKA